MLFLTNFMIVIIPTVSPAFLDCAWKGEDLSYLKGSVQRKLCRITLSRAGRCCTMCDSQSWLQEIDEALEEHFRHELVLQGPWLGHHLILQQNLRHKVLSKRLNSVTDWYFWENKNSRNQRAKVADSSYLQQFSRNPKVIFWSIILRKSATFLDKN